MAFTPPKKDKLTGILAIIFYFAAGLLLLVRPDIMGELTRWTLTVVLGVYAVLQAVRYFRLSPAEAAKGYNLTAALMAGTLALLSVLDASLVTGRLWGVLILCGAYMKFQTSWDLYRLGHSRWWWILICTAVSLLFGILILTGAITSNLAVWLGIALLLEAAVDTAVQVMVARSEKWNVQQRKKAMEPPAPAASPAEPQPAPPAPVPASEPAAAEPPAPPAQPAEPDAPEMAE